MLLATRLTSLPAGAVAILVVLSLAQLALDVIALVDLYRRPVEQVAGGNKWVWVVVILIVNVLGPILYLAIARQPPPAVETRTDAERGSERIGDIVDDLYGPHDSASH
ncbi:MAG TPA: PLDc N-terminal domain-containing protein [Candidatus Dormibacteraeota bacterium]